MQMTGHKTRSVFERYNIVSEGDLEQAAQRLDDFSGTNLGTIHPLEENPSTVSSLESSTRP
jgi:hypothetical protein